MSKFKEENFSIFAKRLEEIDWEKVEAYHQKLSKKEAISREEELPVEVYAALRCLFRLNKEAPTLLEKYSKEQITMCKDIITDREFDYVLFVEKSSKPGIFNHQSKTSSAFGNEKLFCSFAGNSLSKPSQKP